MRSISVDTVRTVTEENHDAGNLSYWTLNNKAKSFPFILFGSRMGVGGFGGSC